MLFLGAVASAGDDNLIIDLAGLNPKEIRTLDGEPAANLASVARDKHGAMVFRLEAGNTTRQQWLLPITAPAGADGLARISVRSENMGTGREPANVYLILEAPAAPASGKALRRTVPLFTAAGKADSEIGRVRFAAGGTRFRLRGVGVDLPRLAAGPALLSIHTLRITLAGNLPDPATVTRALAAPTSTRAEVRPGPRGRPRLVINGKPVASLSTPAAGPGIRRLALNLGGPDPEQPAAPRLRPFPDFFDYDALDEAVRRAAAGGYVILELLMRTPPAWLAAEPETKGWSDLAPAWRQEMERGLQLLLAHLRGRPLGAKVIGCTIRVGPGLNEWPPPSRTRSPAYLAAFRAWLKTRYANDAGLQQAWQLPAATLAAAEPLATSRWPRGNVGKLLHPLAAGRAQDSALFYNRSWAGTIEHFAQRIKYWTHNSYVVGAGAGALNVLSRQRPNRFQPAPGGLAQLLASPHLDFFEVRASELNADGGSGDAGCDLALLEATRRRGKLLWMHCRLDQPTPAAGSPEDRRQIGWRTLLAGIVNGMGLHVVGGEAAELERFASIAAKALEADLATNAKAAFVIDPQSLRYLAPDADAALATGSGVQAPASRAFYLLELPTHHWSRAGFPFDVVLLDDLRPERYKLLVFFHTLRLDGRRRKLVESAKKDGRTLVWLWADGVVSERFIATRALTEVAGIKIDLRRQGARLFLQPGPELGGFVRTDRIETYLGGQAFFREPERAFGLTFAPSFAGVAASPATVLANLADGGQPAMLLKRTPKWKALYSASPVLNPEVLRAIAAEAGLHTYLATNDWSAINSSFIAVYASAPGIRTIRLPEPEALYEVLREQELPAAKEHRLELTGKRAYLFWRGGKKEWTKP